MAGLCLDLLFHPSTLRTPQTFQKSSAVSSNYPYIKTSRTNCHHQHFWWCAMHLWGLHGQQDLHAQNTKTQTPAFVSHPHFEAPPRLAFQLLQPLACVQAADVPRIAAHDSEGEELHKASKAIFPSHLILDKCTGAICIHMRAPHQQRTRISQAPPGCGRWQTGRSASVGRRYRLPTSHLLLSCFLCQVRASRFLVGDISVRTRKGATGYL